MRRLDSKIPVGGRRRLGAVRMSGRAVLAVVTIASVAALGVLGWRSWSLWQQLTAPVPKSTPYNESYQAKEYPGKQFLSELAAAVPDGVDPASWVVSSDGKNDTSVRVLPSECTQIAPSVAQLAYKTAKADGVTVSIMIYGAGQARTQFDKYASQLAECKGAKADGSLVRADGGAVMTRGDAIVSVLSSDSGLLDKMVPWYQGKLEEALLASSCVSLDETAADASRSFYYDSNAYTGTTRSEKVVVEDQILQASSPQLLASNGMSVARTFADPQDKSTVKQPLSPLPAGMETNLPAAPAVPAISVKPDLPATEKTVTYQIADKTGPGCGWTWSGQKTPEFDEGVIEANRETTLKNAKTELKNNIATYNKSIASWSSQTALAMSFQTSWDDYVGKTNAIYASWNDLNEKRAAIQDQWFTYVDEANKWLTWSDDVDKAQKDWEDAIRQCVKSAIDDDSGSESDDEDENGDSSDGSTDSDSEDDEYGEDGDTGLSASQVQKQCLAANPKPAILDEERPEKPVPPTIPQGVTLPSTWPSDPLA